MSEPAEKFKQRMAETIAWCSRMGDINNPKRSLRSQVLRPLNSLFREDRREWASTKGYDPANEKTMFRSEEDQTDATTLHLERREQCKLSVELVAERRKQELTRLQIPEDEQMRTGRLLLYFPEYSDWDGLSESYSNGFFSVNDDPPWDTWIDFVIDDRREGYFGYLVSWVPEEFCNFAGQGIPAAALQCIQWANQIVWQDIYIPEWLSPFCQFSEASSGKIRREGRKP